MQTSANTRSRNQCCRLYSAIESRTMAAAKNIEQTPKWSVRYQSETWERSPCVTSIDIAPSKTMLATSVALFIASATTMIRRLNLSLITTVFAKYSKISAVEDAILSFFRPKSLSKRKNGVYLHSHLSNGGIAQLVRAHDS